MNQQLPKELDVPCPFCGSGICVPCELETRPTSYAVVCRDCGATGPRGDSFVVANKEWADRYRPDESAEDEELEMLVTQRPELLNRIVASGMLGAAVRELAAMGTTPDELIDLINEAGPG